LLDYFPKILLVVDESHVTLSSERCMAVTEAEKKIW
jgi:excinuclease UvrABC helicase subunit UvrB